MTLEFEVLGRKIGLYHPTYFIADIAANHDGDLKRAKELVYLAAEAGADAVKFQHFKADKIVSDYGFRNLGNQQSHQAGWTKSVFEVYQDASLNRDWTGELVEAAKDAGVHFFSTPYDIEAVQILERYNVPAYKMGSGDITWPEIIEVMAGTGKPQFVATGASDLSDVDRVMQVLSAFDVPICLMQCNTNYTGSLENMRHIHLNVLKSYATRYPGTVLGLSDHTPGHATVLGAVALGARAVEKHFTDNTGREGPDHVFSMDPVTWRDMVDRTRELEAALGSEEKFVAENESETAILQRRCLRVVKDMKAGHVLKEEDLTALRPAPKDAVLPYEIESVVGLSLKRDLPAGEYLRKSDVAG